MDKSNGKRSAAAVMLALVLGTGCELEQVVIAVPEDVVIAEVILRAGAPAQHAWLHRTRGGGPVATVDNAVIEVRSDDDPRVLRFFPMAVGQCVNERSGTPPQSHGSCYQTPAGADQLPITPGSTYRLRITLPDGKRLSGVTTVPRDFQLLRPTLDACRVEEMTPFEVRWTSSPGTWVYAAETNLRGIVSALQPHNVTVNEDPLRLFGLSLSSADTTILFPTEFGLFDRFDEDLTGALAFLQKGLPRGVSADVAIAAADRNYVNWERGGNFNPSGFVRVPSVSGAGTGVFGSLVPKTFQVFAGIGTRPPC